MSILKRYRIVLFLGLTCALSSGFYIRIASTGKLKMLPVLGLMWCPGAAGIILRLLTQGNLKGMGWKWGATRWPLLGYVLPPLVGTVVYGLVWLTGVGVFTPSGLDAGKEVGVRIPLLITIVVLVTLGLVQSVVFALGEEIGWRGFLVPELAQGSTFTTTALISGVAWSVYHYPLIFFADYNSGAPKWFALAAFTWMVVASSFIYAWLRLKSGSLWPAAILHASHNLFIQQIFDPLTKDREHTKYFTTEFGVGLAVAYTLVAIYFWRRRGELPAPPKTEDGSRAGEVSPVLASGAPGQAI